MRMPNTATAMPTVMKICRQRGLIALSTVALTTALSKETLVSSTASTAAVTRKAPACSTPPWACPYQATMASTATLKASEPRK